MFAWYRFLAILLIFSIWLSEYVTANEKKVALLFLTVKDPLHPNLWKQALKSCEDKFNIYVHSKKGVRAPISKNSAFL